jgi:hypothetical protein
MNLRVAILIACIAGALVPVAASTPCSAATASRAGLVVNDGTTTKYFCVPVSAQMSGIDLLQRSGLKLAVQDYGGDSVTVCRIGGTGTDYPTKSCFADCPNVSRECRFWGYYLLGPDGSWRFSNEGPGSHRVRAGEVEGWRWGIQTTGGGDPPSAGTSLADVCAHATRVAARAPSPGSRAAVWPIAMVAIVLAGAGVAGRRLIKREPAP